MNLTHIEHIGIAVNNLEVSISYWEKVFNVKCSAIAVLSKQQVKTAFFQVGQARIELIESTALESPIRQFIYKDDEGILQMVFEGKKSENSSSVTKAIVIQLIDEQSCKDAVNMFNEILYPELTFNAMIGLCEN
jgi:methylmalonyl-CoA/ethylmalonyl-CoA epimerase